MYAYQVPPWQPNDDAVAVPWHPPEEQIRGVPSMGTNSKPDEKNLQWRFLQGNCMAPRCLRRRNPARGTTHRLREPAQLEQGVFLATPGAGGVPAEPRPCDSRNIVEESPNADLEIDEEPAALMAVARQV